MKMAAPEAYYIKSELKPISNEDKDLPIHHIRTAAMDLFIPGSHISHIADTAI